MVTINFVGDIMLGDSAFKLGVGVGSSIFVNGNSYIFDKISPLLRRECINVGNLECAFAKEKTNPYNSFSPYLVYSPEYIKCLQDADFHVLNMANNHTMQYGSDIFNHTEKLLIENGIRPIGTINNPYNILDVQGIRFAFLGYSMRPNQFKHKDIQYIEGERKKILANIKSIKKCDHVIVLFHWGDENVDYPGIDQKHLAHELIDTGAKLIIGHHPHILQGIEEYKEGVVAYSLGNFVFDKPQKLQRQSVILQATFSKDKLEKINLIPIHINNNYQPEVASGRNKKEIENSILRLNKKIEISSKYDRKRYYKDVAKGLYRMRLQFYIFFLMNIYVYRPKILFSLVRDAIMRRLCNNKND